MDVVDQFIRALAQADTEGRQWEFIDAFFHEISLQGPNEVGIAAALSSALYEWGI